MFLISNYLILQSVYSKLRLLYIMYIAQWNYIAIF